MPSLHDSNTARFAKAYADAALLSTHEREGW